MATWAFSSSDTTVTQASYDVQVYNNSTGALVFDTGSIASSVSQYVIPANTLVNGTEYKWRVQYTDSGGNASPWSDYQVFKCSSAPTVSVTSPTSAQTITANTVTVAGTYSQSQGVSEQSFRAVIFASDQSTIYADSGTVLNTANQYSVSGLPNGTYYAQFTVTSADGLSTTSGKVQFTVNFNGLASSVGISTTPLPDAAAIRVDFYTPKSIPGTYVGPGETYKPGKWGQAIQVAALGEKVYFTVAPFNQFMYTSWFSPQIASSAMKNDQVIAHIQADANNYVEVRYDPVGQTFILDYCVAGNILTTVSPSGLTFNANDWLMVALRQTSTLDAFVGIGGNWYKWTVEVDTTTTSNTIGVMTFGTGTYANPVVVKNMSYTTAYIGCSPQDGNEANALFDQTHLTAQTLTDSDIEELYTNATQQTFNFESMFLANFDGDLEGGTATPTPIDHWNVYRLYNGIQKLLATISNTGQPTVSYTDSTPFSGLTYQYNVVPVDTSGNIGNPQTAQGSVEFDGWWLSDPTTGSLFQFYLNVADVPLKMNRQRTEYQTSGKYPIVAYSPTRYRTGTLKSMVVDQFNSTQSPREQYESLQSMIDTHNMLLLRGDEGQGFMIDAYGEIDTVPSRNHKQYHNVEISWTEVASA
ncbi:glycoside hydrolase family 78 protein [Alicyclobacillus dauci]|uniref:Uncharacterized protein n=1 Tax=Alicyclobacillus dauci TaxID=1475485 RepID=A0ABY6YWY1_9BACL|nr:hypothetical protein [Alicyclobacillus dauci]WAH35055.1 hypothetical protein NZD86_12025 [Alicyclobacillus dauci]